MSKNNLTEIRLKPQSKFHEQKYAGEITTKSRHHTDCGLQIQNSTLHSFSQNVFL